MARNSVQFQKGLSEAGFMQLYGTEDKCRAAFGCMRHGLSRRRLAVYRQRAGRAGLDHTLIMPASQALQAIEIDNGNTVALAFGLNRKRRGRIESSCDAWSSARTGLD